LHNHSACTQRTRPSSTREGCSFMPCHALESSLVRHSVRAYIKAAAAACWQGATGWQQECVASCRIDGDNSRKHSCVRARVSDCRTPRPAQLALCFRSRRSEKQPHVAGCPVHGGAQGQRSSPQATQDRQVSRCACVRAIPFFARGWSRSLPLPPQEPRQ
jgi:hypothetical protein